jgi:hypothetical protein
MSIVLPDLGRVTCLAYTPDGKSLLCGTGDRNLRVPGHLHVLDVGPLRVRSSIARVCGVQHLMIRRDGEQAVLGTGHDWTFFELATQTIGVYCNGGFNLLADKALVRSFPKVFGGNGLTSLLQ